MVLGLRCRGEVEEYAGDEASEDGTGEGETKEAVLRKSEEKAVDTGAVVDEDSDDMGSWFLLFLLYLDETHQV